MDRKYWLAVAATIAIAALAVATIGMLSPAPTQNTTTPTPTATQTATTSPVPTENPTPTPTAQPSQNATATPTPTPTLTPTPSPTPTPTPNPDASAIQNVTLTAYQQDENGTVTTWMLSGYLVDTATNSSVPGVVVSIANGTNNTIVYVNCTTDVTGYFQGTIQADIQATSVQAVFAGNNQHQACSSSQVPLAL